MDGENRMSEDRRTKAQILEELAETKIRLAAAQNRIPDAPKAIPVANALAGCIRALDLIPPAKASMYASPAASSEVAHVLRHLMTRYGVDLTERVTEPCDRRHVDEATDTELIERIRGFGGF